MTGKTDLQGRPDQAGTCGPYLVQFPHNPFNNRDDVKAMPAGAELTPDDSSGWMYKVEANGSFVIAPNSTALGRAKNRRVDVRLMTNTTGDNAPSQPAAAACGASCREILGRRTFSPGAQKKGLPPRRKREA